MHSYQGPLGFILVPDTHFVCPLVVGGAQIHCIKPNAVSLSLGCGFDNIFETSS